MKFTYHYGWLIGGENINCNVCNKSVKEWFSIKCEDALEREMFEGMSYELDAIVICLSCSRKQPFNRHDSDISNAKRNELRERDRKTKEYRKMMKEMEEKREKQS